MPKPFPSPIRHPARAAGACILLAAMLAGCASKNPLMEEPAASSSVPSRAPAPERAAAGSAPSAPTAGTSTASTGSAVQTTQEKRFLGFFSPYRPDIQQGNFVSQEMIAQVKPGMTPDQVRFALGTPLLTDIFHRERWDYPFRLKKGNGEVTSSRVTVFFKENRVERIEGGDLPTEEDYLARLAGSAPPPKKAPGALPGSPVPESPATESANERKQNQ